MGGDDAAERFWLELRTLYQAAGQPTLQQLVRLGLAQDPRVSIGQSTINGWLNGRAVPTGRKNERYLTAMIAFLQARTKPEAGYERLPPGEWGRLLRSAQAQRAAGKRNGRPRRPDSWTGGPRVPEKPGPAPGLPRGVSAVPGGPLVGRDSELAMLAGLVHGVAAGQGNAVFIEGEPGIGKSSLVQVALAGAGELGCQVCWGTGSELDQALPLQPLLDALRVREPSGNPRRASIARFLRGEAGADRGLDGPAMLAEQLLALIAEECDARPVILVIDDLQWADQSSISLLARLASLVDQLPLLLVGTMRPVPERDDLLALRRAAGGAARLRLAGLATAAVADLVGSLVGGAPDRRLLTLADDAAGNPLYLTELAAALTRGSRITITDAGAATVAAGLAPRSLSAAIADRIGFISRPAREVLRSASLLGPEFAVNDLVTIADRGFADLTAILHEACAAGVLAESGRRLRFRHPLIHTALYEELPVPVRAAWHREAGRALAAAGAPADRVARQLLGAAGEPDGAPEPDGLAEPMDEWMLNWLSEAAEPLVARAPQLAARLLTRAIAGLPAGDAARRGRLAAQLADALYRIGERAMAAELAIRELGNAADTDVLVGLHWTLAQCRMVAGSYAECLATLDRVLAAPGLADRHRGRLLVLAARTHIVSGQLAAAIEVAGTALTVTEQARDPWAQGWALQTMALTATTQGRLADALLFFDRGLTVTGDDPALSDLRLLLQINRAAVLCNLDRFDEGLAIARQARQLADQVGTIIRQTQAHGLLGQLLYETGRWDEALAEMEHMPESLKEHAAASAELGIAALISFHRGDVAAARRCLCAAEPHAARIGSRLIPQLVLARSRDHEQAGALPAALSALTRWLGSGTEEIALLQEIVPDAVRLAVLAGELGAARAIASQGTRYAASTETPSVQGNALYYRGLLDDDSAALLAAAEWYRQAGRPLQRATALEAAAAGYAGDGDGEQAQALLAAATEIYTWLGASVDAARARAAGGAVVRPA